jgi:hypothetical protein
MSPFSISRARTLPIRRSNAAIFGRKLPSPTLGGEAFNDVLPPPICTIANSRVKRFLPVPVTTKGPSVSEQYIHPFVRMMTNKIRQWVSVKRTEACRPLERRQTRLITVPITILEQQKGYCATRAGSGMTARLAAGTMTSFASERSFRRFSGCCPGRPRFRGTAWGLDRVRA